MSMTPIPCIKARNSYLINGVILLASILVTPPLTCMTMYWRAYVLEIRQEKREQLIFILSIFVYHILTTYY